MKILDNYMPLSSGEEIQETLEGNAYTLSANPIDRLIAFIQRILAIITGSPIKVLLVTTNKRVIQISRQRILWFFDGSVIAISFTPRSISSSGYQLERFLLIFKSHYLLFQSSNNSILIKSRDGKSKVSSMISSIAGLAEKVAQK
tara:strand:+ start:1194 stop:1628 length:435 start_codon:yes stop_codon:yes gene_type:complete